MDDSLRRIFVSIVALVGLCAAAYFYTRAEARQPFEVEFVQDYGPKAGVFIVPGVRGECSSCIAECYLPLHQFHDETFVLLPENREPFADMLREKNIQVISYKRVHPTLLDKVFVRDQDGHVVYLCDMELSGARPGREIFTHISQYLK